MKKAFLYFQNENHAAPKALMPGGNKSSKNLELKVAGLSWYVLLPGIKRLTKR